MKYLLAILLLCTSALAQKNTNGPQGLGSSKIIAGGQACLDKDGDGYGVGQGCLGLDADDNDPNVHTGTQELNLFPGNGTGAGASGFSGPVNNWLAHLGYQTLTASGSSISSYATVWVIDGVGGSHGATCHDTNADHALLSPCLTWTDIDVAVFDNANGVGGVSQCSDQIVIFRATGTYNGLNQASGSHTAVGGSASNCRVIYVNYPGEQPFIQVPSNAVGQGFDALSQSYWILDGFKIDANLQGYPAVAVGSPQGSSNGNWIVRNCELLHGVNDSTVDGDNIYNALFEDNVVHDVNTGDQHEVYLGSNSFASYNVIIRRNIIYNTLTGFNQLQFNGRCNQGGSAASSSLWNGTFPASGSGSSCYISQNLIYSGNGSCITVLEGFDYSYITDNVCINSGGGVRIYNYPGNCGPQEICAWNQSHNLIANNTFVLNPKDPLGNEYDNPGANAFNIAILVDNDANSSSECGSGTLTGGFCGDIGHNTWANNIVVAAGDPNDSLAPVRYCSPSDCSTTGNGLYLVNDIWSDNILWSNDGRSTVIEYNGGSSFVRVGCSSWPTGTSGGCMNGDPKFVNWNTSYYATPQSVNVQPSNASLLALNNGNSTYSPLVDVHGSAFWSNPGPSIGAIEIGCCQVGWTELFGTTLLPNSGGNPTYPNSCPTIGMNGSAAGPGGAGGSNAPYNYPVVGDGGCYEEVAAWSGAIARTKSGSEQLDLYGGGHEDYGGNEVYALNLFPTVASVSRLIPPATITDADYQSIPNSGNGVSPVPDSCSAPNCYPAAKHTYEGIAYPGASNDYLLSVAPGGYGPSGGSGYLGNAAVWSYSFSSKQWTCLFSPTGYNASICNAYGSTGQFGWGSPQLAGAYDPNTGNFFVGVPGQTFLIEYNIASPALTAVQSGSTAGAFDSAVIDPVRKRMFWLGSGGFTSADISSLPTAINALSTTNCSTPDAAAGPGAYYNSSDTLIYILPAIDGTGNYWTFNYGTLTCTEHTSVPGTPPPSTTASNNGIFGRFNYFPSKNYSVLIGDMTSDAFVLSTVAATAPPQVTSTQVFSAMHSGKRMQSGRMLTN